MATLMRCFLFIFSLIALVSCGGGGSNEGPDTDEDTDTNRAPTTSNDTAQINEDTVLSSFNVLANDSDPDGDVLSLVSADSVIGNVTISNDAITYTPPANFFGDVIVNYLISDGSLQAAGGLIIEVLPINDAPIANNDSVNIQENSTNNSIGVLLNDSDVDDDPLTITQVSANSGSVSIQDDNIVYTPNTDFIGADTITYSIEDSSGESSSANVDVSVIEEGSSNNNAPVAAEDSVQINEDTVLSNFNVLSNDSDPDGDLLSLVSADPSIGNIDITAGEITYTPPVNFFGEVAVNYTISDGSLQASSALTIEVLPINDAPVARDDSATVQQDSSNNVIDVLSNDSDVDDSELTIIQANANSGSVSIQGDNIVYTPTDGFVGADTITYRIEDNAGESSTAEIDVNVTASGGSGGDTDSLNTQSAGRTIVVSQTRRSTQPDRDPRDFNDWARFSSPTNVNAPTISTDGRSVVFERVTADDGSDARDYLEFTFGPRYAGSRISVSMEVTVFDESSFGAYGDSLHIPSSNLSGNTARQATSTGIWATVLDVGADADETVVRVGLGVTDNDTRTNRIGIRNVQVSHLAVDDDEPNEYVDSNGWLDNPGHNGASLPYSKMANYDSNSGLVTFERGMTSDEPSYSHVVMVTDSFGAFLSGFTREMFFGGIDDLPPRYTLTIDAQAGRQLEDTADGVLLQEMYDIRGHQDASPPGTLIVHLGVNTFMIDSGTSAMLADEALQQYIDFAHDRNMVAVITTATPFKNSTNWTQAKQDEMNTYNALVRARENNDNVRVIDLNAIVDTDGDEIIDDPFLTGSRDFVHVVGPANALLYSAYDDMIREIIAEHESSLPSVTGINARINPSRTSCASPCTVVFSADKTRAEGMDEHQIWDELIYHWDFDTDETDTYGALYSQTYTFVTAGDTAREIGGPMATKTFLCDVGTCIYNVGMRAQNALGEYDDAFVTVTVRAESTEWSAANTVCVSNSLNTVDDWTSFDKSCPAGATKQNDFPSVDDFDGRLILLHKGDVFTRYVATRMGQSNFKIGYFGDDGDPRPEIDGTLNIGPSGIVGTPDAPTAASTAHSDSDIATYGWPENITIDGLRVARVSMPMSYRHIGLHDVDMDRESQPDGGDISISGNHVLCYRNSNLSCSLIPFPHGTYISSTNIVGSDNAITNTQALNVASIGCGMNNFVGIVDSQFRRAGEHNLRIMGWWRVNIMRSAWRGQHYSGGKQKLTTRGCVFGALDRGGWQTASGIDNIFNDVDGAMRSDSHQEGTDNYIHVSRYMVIQGNEIGEPTQLGTQPGTTKIQTNVLSGDEALMQDYLVTKNIFVDTDTGASVDIGLVGEHMTCVNNTYSPGTGCNGTNEERDNISIDPTPLSEPLAPQP